MSLFTRLARCLALVAGLAAWSVTAHAACSDPVGEAGQISYASNLNTFVFCNGTDWVSMAGWNNSSGGGASLLNELTDVDTSGASTGSILSYNGSTWVVSDSAAGADNLGDHTATQALDMGAFNITNAGTVYGTGGAFGGLTVTGASSFTTVSTSLIQVGNTGVACTSGISGSIRYSSVSSTLEYCNSTAWVSVGPSGTLPISFRVDKNGTNQTVTTYTYTNLTWSREVFDTNNNFASNRFTATVPGIYLFTLSAYCEASTNGCQTQIKKNGSGVATDATVGGPNGQTSQVTTLIELAIGDYVEASAANMGATLIGGSPVLTYFTGALLNASSGGGGASVLDDLTDVDTSGASTGSIIAYNGSNWVVSNSGAGVAALASLTDVQLTNLAGRDYLRYDSVAGKWVNISESTVMSTTTMKSGWPDAIQCYGANGSVWLQLSYATASNVVYVAGYTASAATENLRVSFNAGGTWSSVGNTGVWSGYYETNCNSAATTIASLYASGRAFNFIGNANVGGGALGDRITSGTVSVTVNTDGFISLTTGVTDWGYLSSGNSYLPTLVAGRVSSTFVSSSIVDFSGTTIGTLGGPGGNFIASGSTSVSASSNGAITFSAAGSTVMRVNSDSSVVIGNGHIRMLSEGTDFLFSGAGYMSAEQNLHVNIDADNNGTTHKFVIGKDRYGNTGGTDLVTVLESGNVGIGVSNPSHVLQISAQGRSTHSAWATSSDRRVKEDIHTITGGLAAIDKLRPVTFRYTKEYQNGNPALDGIRRGFIAQEVEEVMPDAVSRAEEHVGKRTISDFRVLGNSDFVPLLVSAVKELKAANDNTEQMLRAEIDELRRELRELKQADKK